jgi:hypothetical protein
MGNAARIAALVAAALSLPNAGAALPAHRDLSAGTAVDVVFKRVDGVSAETSPVSCDQAIFVDQATDASACSYAALVEVDGLRQRLQRGGCVQEAVSTVIAQGPHEAPEHE